MRLSKSERDTGKLCRLKDGHARAAMMVEDSSFKDEMAGA